MATLPELEEALAAADAAGDTEAAAHLAGVLQRALQDKSNLIPGVQIPETLPQEPPRSFAEQAVGAGEAALTMGTGATSGLLGMLGGTLKSLAEQILSGQFGTREAAQAVEAAAAQGAQEGTYAPRTSAGQEQVQAIGQVMEGLPAVLPIAGEIAPVASAAARPAAQAARPVAQAAAQAVKEALPTTVSRERPGVLASVGAASTPDALRRVTVAEQLPVPFKGEAGLTLGQASRDFAQLQFEKESAKLGDVGAPLRQRSENQTAVLLQNFDALVDKAGPLAVERRDIGKAVSGAIVNKANAVKKKIDQAYTEAKAAGAMREAVQLDPVAEAFSELERFEGLSPMIKATRTEAQRIGAIVRDERSPGSPIQGGTIPLEGTEQLRQFVNMATDWADPRDAMFAKKIVGSIDAATEGKGGDLYLNARAMRRRYASEFENVGLTAKLLGTKRGTSERQVAFEDVFDKVILLSPVEEMNKLRGTLLQSGAEGKQAWADLKAAGIEHIKESSLSASGRDAAGQPLISPDKLSRVIGALDRGGKLESLYGKKQAQTLRDLGELASVIYTAPPGAVNFSGTASALRIVMDSIITNMLTGALVGTGVPLPAATALKQAAQYSKNRKLKARINEALASSIKSKE